MKNIKKEIEGHLTRDITIEKGQIKKDEIEMGKMKKKSKMPPRKKK